MQMPARAITRCKSSCAFVAIGALPLITGCAGTALPNWLNPGPTRYQVSQADTYDPYPDPSIGPPIVGRRPIGYMDPRAKPDPAKITPPMAGMAPAYPAAPVTYPPPAAYPPGTATYPPVYVPAAQCPPTNAAPVAAATTTTLPIAATTTNSIAM